MAETVKKGQRITGADRAKQPGDLTGRVDRGDDVRPIERPTATPPPTAQTEGVAKADPDQRLGSE